MLACFTPRFLYCLLIQQASYANLVLALRLLSNHTPWHSLTQATCWAKVQIYKTPEKLSFHFSLFSFSLYGYFAPLFLVSQRFFSYFFFISHINRIISFFSAHFNSDLPRYLVLHNFELLFFIFLIYAPSFPIPGLFPVFECLPTRFLLFPVVSFVNLNFPTVYPSQLYYYISVSGASISSSVCGIYSGWNLCNIYVISVKSVKSVQNLFGLQ